MENRKNTKDIQTKTFTKEKVAVAPQIGQGVLLGLSVALLATYLYGGLLAGFIAPLVKQQQSNSQGGGGEAPLVNWTYQYVRPATQSPLWEEDGSLDGYYRAFQYTDNIAMSSDHDAMYYPCNTNQGVDHTYYRWDRTGHQFPGCNFNSLENPPINMQNVYSIDFIVVSSTCYECNPNLQLGTTIRLDRSNGWTSAWQNGGRGFNISATWSESNTLLHYFTDIYEYAGGGPFGVIFEVRYRTFVGQNTCSDGTPYYQCSTQKPYYCDPNQGLIPRCDLCGCPGNAPICCPYGGCQSVECGGGSPAILKGGSPAVMKAPQWWYDQMNDWCEDHPNDPLCYGYQY